jgi:hypothetical protein
MVPDQKPDSEPTAHVTGADRDALIAEYNKLMDNMSGWQFHMGPIRLSGYFTSMRFARYFVGFHIVVGVAGAVLIFFGGPPRDLGMAMVVGALFGFGAFLAQVWTVQVEKEHSVLAGQAREKYLELVEKLRAVEQAGEAAWSVEQTGSGRETTG